MNLLKEHVKQRVRVMIVAGSRPNTDEPARRLSGCLQLESDIIRSDGGFTELIEAIEGVDFISG